MTTKFFSEDDIRDIRMLFGMGNGTLPYTLQEICQGLNESSFANTVTFVGLLLGSVLVYFCLKLGSSVARRFR